jgi:hypothetical protein
MKRKADKLRKEIAALIVLADQLDSLRYEFEQRIADHEKWRDKPTKEPEGGASTVPDE